MGSVVDVESEECSDGSESLGKRVANVTTRGPRVAIHLISERG